MATPATGAGVAACLDPLLLLFAACHLGAAVNGDQTARDLLCERRDLPLDGPQLVAHLVALELRNEIEGPRDRASWVSGIPGGAAWHSGGAAWHSGGVAWHSRAVAWRAEDQPEVGRIQA